MGRFFKLVGSIIGLVIVILVALVLSRVSGKPVITNAPAKNLNALNLQLAGVEKSDPKAWADLANVLKEPSDLWQATTEAAGGKDAKPADWPEGYNWPYDTQDALRPGAPAVVTSAATKAIETLRTNGTFERLAAARNGPVPVFEIQSTDSSSLLMTLMPELGGARGTARHQSLRMKMALDRGDEKEFLEAVRDNRFVATTTSQCFLIGALVTHAIDALNAGQIRHALVEHRLSPETLVALDDVLRTVDARATMRHAFKAERFAQQDMVQRLFTDDGNGNGHMASDMSSFNGLIPNQNMPKSGFLGAAASFIVADRRDTEAAFDTLRDAALKQLDHPSLPDTDPALDSMVASYSKHRYPFVYILAPALGGSVSATMLIETNINATRIMIALERHQRSKSAYPATLDELVPEFLAELPKDSLSGVAWGYKVLPAPDEHGRRYLLYSFGTDQADDGGLHSEESRKTNGKSKGKDYLFTAPRE